MSDNAIESMRAFLQALGLTEDVDSELARTPSRFAELIADMSIGLTAPAPILSTFTLAAQSDGHPADPVMLLGLSFHSLCVHHLVPFFGTIDVAYLPDQKMVGFGSIGRVIDHFARRPQVQERLVSQIADHLQEHLEPRGLLIRCQARQMCMELRGAKKRGAIITLASRGVLHEGPLRQELLTQFASAQSSV